MHESLRAIIREFRAAQDLAVVTLRDRLGVPMPCSNIEWTQWAHFGDTPQHDVLHELGRQHGLHIRTHGFGVEIRFPHLCIDFDWGDHGESYGFDAWRLWNHCWQNRFYLDRFTHELLRLRFQKAESDGDLIRDGHLCYLPDERSRFGAR